MFNRKLEQVVNILRDVVRDHGNSICNIWIKFRESDDKVNSLYKKDYHGFSRPKVDILEDNTNDNESEIWKFMSNLEKRIEELEGKKK